MIECIPPRCDYGSPYSYTTTGATFGTAGTAGLLQPDECFKIDAKPDWLSGYSVEFTPKNDGVTWGEIDWFGDLEYEARTFEASDFAMDICDMLFEDEVDRAFEEDWTRTASTPESYRCDDGTGGGNIYIRTWKVGPVLFDDDGHARTRGLRPVSSRPSGSTTTSTATS